MSSQEIQIIFGDLFGDSRGDAFVCGGEKKKKAATESKIGSIFCILIIPKPKPQIKIVNLQELSQRLMIEVNFIVAAIN